MIAILWLVGCGANSMRAVGDLPIRLGSVKSASWIEDRWSDPDEGHGSATLILASVELSCSDVADLVSGVVDEGDEVWFDNEASGVVVDFGFAGDQTFEGDYYGGFLPLGYYYYYDTAGLDEPLRWMSVAAFDDGQSFDLYEEPGHAEITADGDPLTGSLRSSSLELRFAATDCGQVEIEPADTGF